MKRKKKKKKCSKKKKNKKNDIEVLQQLYNNYMIFSKSILYLYNEKQKYDNYKLLLSNLIHYLNDTILKQFIMLLTNYYKDYYDNNHHQHIISDLNNIYKLNTINDIIVTIKKIMIKNPNNPLSINDINNKKIRLLNYQYAEQFKMILTTSKKLIESFQLTIVLIFYKVTNTIIHIPKKLIPEIIEYLKDYIDIKIYKIIKIAENKIYKEQQQQEDDHELQKSIQQIGLNAKDSLKKK